MANPMQKINVRFHAEATDKAEALAVREIKKSEAFRVALEIGLQQLASITPAKREALVKRVDRHLMAGIEIDAVAELDKL